MAVEFANRTIIARAQRADVKKPVVRQPDVIFKFAGVCRWLSHRDLPFQTVRVRTGAPFNIP